MSFGGSSYCGQVMLKLGWKPDMAELNAKWGGKAKLEPPSTQGETFALDTKASDTIENLKAKV